VKERVSLSYSYVDREQLEVPRTKIHTYAVDSFSDSSAKIELLEPFRISHQGGVYIMDMEKFGKFWILVEIPAPNGNTKGMLFLCDQSIKYPHCPEKAIEEFVARGIFKKDTLLVIDGNKKMDLCELLQLQKNLRTQHSITLMSHPWGVRLPWQALVERKIKDVKQGLVKFPLCSIHKVADILNFIE
jgi:hypothetical protein